RDDVRRAHEMECRGLGGRNERRIRGPAELAEELPVEAAEVIDRLRLRHPEVPSVELRETCKPAGAKERLEVNGSQSCEDGNQNRDARPGTRARRQWRQPPAEPQ